MDLRHVPATFAGNLDWIPGEGQDMGHHHYVQCCKLTISACWWTISPASSDGTTVNCNELSCSSYPGEREAPVLSQACGVCKSVAPKQVNELPMTRLIHPVRKLHALLSSSRASFLQNPFPLTEPVCTACSQSMKGGATDAVPWADGVISCVGGALHLLSLCEVYFFSPSCGG